MGFKTRITECLDIDVDEEMWHCNRCGYSLISARENYKKGCLVYDQDPWEIWPSVTGEKLDYRPDPNWCRIVNYYCPGCGTLIELDVLPPGHPIIHDIELDIDKLKAKYSKT